MKTIRIGSFMALLARLACDIRAIRIGEYWLAAWFTLQVVLSVWQLTCVSRVDVTMHDDK